MALRVGLKSGVDCLTYAKDVTACGVGLSLGCRSTIAKYVTTNGVGFSSVVVRPTLPKMSQLAALGLEVGRLT